MKNIVIGVFFKSFAYPFIYRFIIYWSKNFHFILSVIDQCTGARAKLIWHIPVTLFAHWSQIRCSRLLQSSTSDQGSVVVPFRRTTHSSFVVSASSLATCTIAVNIPQLQHLIPDPAYPKGNSLFGYRYLAYKQDQGSVLVHNTKTPANRGVMWYN